MRNVLRHQCHQQSGCQRGWPPHGTIQQQERQHHAQSAQQCTHGAKAALIGTEQRVACVEQQVAHGDQARQPVGLIAVRNRLRMKHNALLGERRRLIARVGPHAQAVEAEHRREYRQADRRDQEVPMF